MPDTFLRESTFAIKTSLNCAFAWKNLVFFTRYSLEWVLFGKRESGCPLKNVYGNCYNITVNQMSKFHLNVIVITDFLSEEIFDKT
jgi:hypothetical protein